MKKLNLVLCVLVCLFVSCGSDDEGSETSTDLIIGTWNYYKTFEDGVEFDLTDCETQETWVFSTNSNLEITQYDDFEGPCEQDFFITATWANIGNSVYELAIAGQTITQEVVFEDNTFSVTYTDTEDTDIIVYKDVYIKN